MTWFEEIKPRLLGVAYRILGSWTDAEDVVQETWIAWQEVDEARIESPPAYLTQTVANRSLNRLRERTRRREDYIGTWLPEPVDPARLPEEHSEIADSLSYAMLVLLERLTPLERATFVLCDVFAFSSTEAAESLGSTPAAVRQALARGRRHLRDGDRTYVVDGDRRRAVVNEFVTALLNGDVSTAIEQLSPEVVLVTDGGGEVSAALRPIDGPRKVVGFLQGLATKYADFTLEMRELNQMPALVVRPTLETPTILLVDLAADGRIGEIWAVRNPAKIARILADDDHAAD